MVFPLYDNEEHHFSHTDTDRRVGLVHLAELLRLPAPIEEQGVLYDLRFFSGGIGIDDKHAATIPGNDNLWRVLRDSGRPRRRPHVLT